MKKFQTFFQKYPFDLLKRFNLGSFNSSGFFRFVELLKKAFFFRRSKTIPQPTENLSPNKIVQRRILRLVIGTFLLALVMVFFLWKEEAAEVSKLAKPPRMITTPGGNNQRDSDRYQQTVKLANHNNVERVQETDESYILIPEVIPESVDVEPLSEILPWKPRETGFEIDGPFVPSDRDGNGTLAKYTNASDEESIEVTLTQSIMEHLNKTPEPVAIDSILDSNRTNLLSTKENPQAGYYNALVSYNPSTANYWGQEGVYEKGTNPYTQPFLDQMNAITRAMGIKPSDSLVLINTRDRVFGNGNLAEGENVTDPVSSNGNIIAGSILYGYIIANVSSDVLTPIIAEISLGEFKGWRLVGSFSSKDSQQGLIVEFNTMVDPYGKEYSVQAIAIDGFDGESFIASKVDQRWIQRYGTIFAASFVSGLTENLATPRQFFGSVGNNPVVISDPPNRNQSLFAGLGKGVDAFASDLVSNSPKGPVISINAGHPVGILFVRSFVGTQSNPSH